MSVSVVDPIDGEVPVRVLVIDDQDSMRAIVRRLLKDIGIRQSAEAAHGEAALKLIGDLADRPFDLIITDLHMEPVDGLSLIRKLRRSKTLPTKDLPILVLTGDRDPMLKDAARQTGANGFMTKPITAQQLRMAVEKLVGFRW